MTSHYCWHVAVAVAVARNFETSPGISVVALGPRASSCKTGMVRVRFSLVSRYKCESPRAPGRGEARRGEGGAKGGTEGKGCRTVCAREPRVGWTRDVGRGVACQDSVAPHPRAATANPFGQPPSDPTLNTHQLRAGWYRCTRTQRLQGILGDDRDAVTGSG